MKDSLLHIFGQSAEACHSHQTTTLSSDCELAINQNKINNSSRLRRKDCANDGGGVYSQQNGQASQATGDTLLHRNDDEDI